ncbi:MAG: hypothetical protein WD157_00885, partial [Patescibacteria group bacterium]
MIFTDLKLRIVPLIVLIAWSVAYISQINYDAWRYYSPSVLNTSFNEFIEPQPLSPQNTRLISFGATEFAANIYWLQLIQYYGGGTPYGQYRKLPELFDTVTELSPNFQQAYITGLIILPGEGFVDQALSLGEKGQKNLPDSWEMPYYTGLVYHIYKKDYAQAGAKFNQAATFAGAPAITKLFAGIYFKEADQRKKAYLIFQTVVATSEDQYIIARAEKQLAHLDGIFTLESAASIFSTPPAPLLKGKGQN